MTLIPDLSSATMSYKFAVLHLEFSQSQESSSMSRYGCSHITIRDLQLTGVAFLC